MFSISNRKAAYTISLELFHCFKRIYISISFVVTTVGVVSCGGP